MSKAGGCAALVVLWLGVTPVSAGVVALAEACLGTAAPTPSGIAACIAEAHADCLSEPPEAPNVATLCFHDRRAEWGAGIQTLLEHVPDDAATAVRIELKYDLLTALLQCDRAQELAVALSDDPAEVVQRHKAQCEAAATATAWVQLRQRVQAGK